MPRAIDSSDDVLGMGEWRRKLGGDGEKIINRESHYWEPSWRLYHDDALAIFDT